MKLSDEKLKEIIGKADRYYHEHEKLPRARSFLLEVFDWTEPIGYIDGEQFAKEAWLLENPIPVWSRIE